ncbi:MAG: hypothetical protein ACFFCF_12480 [Promethearchaeota archaeon]
MNVEKKGVIKHPSSRYEVRAISSWIVSLLGIPVTTLGHYKIMGEEQDCLQRYGGNYRTYMKRVPRYLLIKTRIK